MLHVLFCFFKCRPLPNHGYVEDYIKAYYLSENDTEDWIRKHTVGTICILLHIFGHHKENILFDSSITYQTEQSMNSIHSYHAHVHQGLTLINFMFTAGVYYKAATELGGNWGGK